jgi:hypothetical protein
VPVAAGEGGHECGRVGPVVQRQPGQLQSGRPPFGALRKRRDLGLGQVQAHDLPEQGRRLVAREPQSGGAHLGEPAAGPQARQRQGRVRPAGEHEAQLCGRAVEQHRQAVVDGGSDDPVVVVEDQRHLVAPGDQRVDQ